MTNSNNDIKIVKQQITEKSRKLSARWTVDKATDILTVLGQDIQDEIDWQVLCELDFSDTAREAGRDVIEAWCKETFNHGYFVFSTSIMFGREADAEFFLLRWS